MSIFSPNIILSEKEELELYLGKKISKNEYNNFSSDITGLSETIKKNPHVFKNIVSDIITETEAEKVKPLSALISESEKVKSSDEKSSQQEQRLPFGSPDQGRLSSPPPLQRQVSSQPDQRQRSSPQPLQRQVSSQPDQGQLSLPQQVQRQRSLPQQVQRQRSLPQPDKRLPNRSTNSKYESQTADMEQKYLKYKNKYLSLKQELGV
jgi:hypothetical protein